MDIKKGAASIAVVTTALVGCNDKSPEEPPATIERRPAYIDCRPDTTDALGHFALDVTGEVVTYDDTHIEIRDFVDQNPQLGPQALVDLYRETNRDLTEGNDFELVFEPGVIQEDWERPYSDMVTMNGEKQLLIGKIDSLLRTLSEYPEGLFAALDVDTVRVADEHAVYAGHFNQAANEIVVEFGEDITNSHQSLQLLRRTVAHELLGHAVHSKYCQTHIDSDEELSRYNDGFDYIGVPADTSPEAVQRHLEQVPQELTTYGPERTFARNYGAATVAEDFATIVEFTLEKRGLIREGDADYDSPLYHKQRLVVDRAEEILPGFRAAAETRTNLLRSDPNNEANALEARPIEVPPALVPDAATYNQDEDYDFSYFDTSAMVPVLNGVFYDPHTKERGGTFYHYPAVHINAAGEVTAIRFIGEAAQGTRPIIETEQFRYFRGHLSDADIVMMSRESFETIGHSSIVMPEQTNPFFETNPEPVVIDRTE